jgi:hypothetical protein
MNDTPFAIIFVSCCFANWFGVWCAWKFFRKRKRTALLEQSSDWAEVNGRVTNSKIVWAHVDINCE